MSRISKGYWNISWPGWWEIMKGYKESGSFILCQTETRDADWAGMTVRHEALTKCLATPSLHLKLPCNTEWTCTWFYFLHSNRLTTFSTRMRALVMIDINVNKTSQNRLGIEILGPNQCSRMAHTKNSLVNRDRNDNTRLLKSLESNIFCKQLMINSIINHVSSSLVMLETRSGHLAVALNSQGTCKKRCDLTWKSKHRSKWQINIIAMEFFGDPIVSYRKISGTARSSSGTAEHVRKCNDYEHSEWLRSRGDTEKVKGRITKGSWLWHDHKGSWRLERYSKDNQQRVHG